MVTVTGILMNNRSILVAMFPSAFASLFIYVAIQSQKLCFCYISSIFGWLVAQFSPTHFIHIWNVYPARRNETKLSHQLCQCVEIVMNRSKGRKNARIHFSNLNSFVLFSYAANEFFIWGWRVLMVTNLRNQNYLLILA